MKPQLASAKNTHHRAALRYQTERLRIVYRCSILDADQVTAARLISVSSCIESTAAASV